MSFTRYEVRGIKMTNRLLSIVRWLILVLSITVIAIVTGCEQKYSEEVPVLTYGRAAPLNDPNFVVPGYASAAIEATGGRRAWTKTEQIEFDCVVTFYNQDGSFYLTEQHHEIAPWSNSIRISAIEPHGRFVWELSGDTLSTLESADSYPVRDTRYEMRDVIYAILNITTAPARFLDESVLFTKISEPVKVEGRWYHPIERASIFTVRGPGWSKVVFYQNTGSSLVDMIWHADFEREKFLMVRGYDYRELEKGGVLVPAKIELFKTDAGGVLQRRLVEINRHKK